MSEAATVELASIATLTEAVERMVAVAGIAPKDMAERLGLSYGHYVRMLRRGDAMNFPPDLLERAMRECKSVLPLEWLAYRMGYALHDMTLTSILAAIRDAFTEDGKAVRFMFCGNGRVERQSFEGDGHGNQ